MEKRKLVILAPLDTEARAIASALGARYRSSLSADEPIQCPEFDALLYRIGLRACRMPRHLSQERMCGVILAGLAGGLDPSLRVGDVVADARPPEGWPGVADGAYLAATIHSTHELVATPTEKAALFACEGSAAVDMEGARVAAEAERIGVPFLNLRAISDTAHEALDPAFLSFIDATGRPRLPAIAAALLTRPALVMPVLRLARNTRIATESLGAAVRSILQQSRPRAVAPDGRKIQPASISEAGTPTP